MNKGNGFKGGFGEDYVLKLWKSPEFVAKANKMFCDFYRVTLEDLYNGKTTKLQLSKNVICTTCKG